MVGQGARVVEGKTEKKKDGEDRLFLLMDSLQNRISDQKICNDKDFEVF